MCHMQQLRVERARLANASVMVEPQCLIALLIESQLGLQWRPFKQHEGGRTSSDLNPLYS